MKLNKAVIISYTHPFGQYIHYNSLSVGDPCPFPVETKTVNIYPNCGSNPMTTTLLLVDSTVPVILPSSEMYDTTYLGNPLASDSERGVQDTSTDSLPL